MTNHDQWHPAEPVTPGVLGTTPSTITIYFKHGGLRYDVFYSPLNAMPWAARYGVTLEANWDVTDMEDRIARVEVSVAGGPVQTYARMIQQVTITQKEN